jgi:ketosteroid isomerase-like protein
MEIRMMNDEQRKAIVLEYSRRLDAGPPFFELFDDDAEVYFRKWGMATGRQQFEALFAGLSRIISRSKHDLAYMNVVQQSDMVVIEGTSSGTSASGKEWRAGKAAAGRWCDVFEVRDSRIQRCCIYFEPDCDGVDVERYPWPKKIDRRRGATCPC